MMEIYERAGREIGYWASYYLRMLRDLRGLATARHLLHSKATSEGYARLRDAGRLDLTVEASVMRPEFEPLFTAEELNLAHDRLARYGYLLGDASRSREELLAPTLASILRATRRADTSVVLPESRAVAAVQTLLRQEKRSGRFDPEGRALLGPEQDRRELRNGGHVARVRPRASSRACRLGSPLGQVLGSRPRVLSRRRRSQVAHRSRNGGVRRHPSLRAVP